MYDRNIYFDAVRGSLFGGVLTQQQVDGQEHILACWEDGPEAKQWDRRWLAYALATTKHETAATMWPIEEYGQGNGQPYGESDPETGQAYYGRGLCQLTWRDNYRRATVELGISGGPNDLEWHAEHALDPSIAAEVMFRGMAEGWFRTGPDGKPETLGKYFSDVANDAYGAREIINGDKKTVPSWSGGMTIGNLIAGYHAKFLTALDRAWTSPTPDHELVVTVIVPEGVRVEVIQQQSR